MLTLPSVLVFPPYTTLPADFQFVVTMGWYMFVFGYARQIYGLVFNIYILTDERVVDIDFQYIFRRFLPPRSRRFRMLISVFGVI